MRGLGGFDCCCLGARVEWFGFSTWGLHEMHGIKWRLSWDLDRGWDKRACL